ncbi:MAG TPA: Asp-tRNA(Asn)/Glu-tRNA(Gln) amidotransferase subunit GatC [Candidatus Moranbacteria bacterium]|nr:Asp-tRNA(Asn)/Glu-tRNA(Gln) amidotransferase subunit GatC [Candidatus Moranbacteria bacterium]
MISKDEVKHIAALARIGLSDEEIEKYQKDLSTVLDWVEQLKEVDVENVEPVSHIIGMENVVRDDKKTDYKHKGKITEMFPEKKDNYDKVKSAL